MLQAGWGSESEGLDFCLLKEPGGRRDAGVAPPGADALAELVRGVGERHGQPVRAAIESMN